MKTEIDWELIARVNKKRWEDITLRRVKATNQAKADGYVPCSLIKAMETCKDLKEVQALEFYSFLFSSSSLPLEAEGKQNKGEYHGIIQALNLKAQKKYKEYQAELKETVYSNIRNVAKGVNLKKLSIPAQYMDIIDLSNYREPKKKVK